MYLKLVTSTKRDKGLMLFQWTLLLKKEVKQNKLPRPRTCPHITLEKVTML